MRAPELLQEWRKGRGLKQVAAAKLFGVSGAALSDWESGKKIARLRKAVEIAQVTDGAVPVESWGSTPVAAEAAAPGPEAAE